MLNKKVNNIHYGRSIKKVILGSNANNGSNTSLFYFNGNNEVSNTNVNNGSKLQTVGIKNIKRVLLFASPLGEK